MTYNIEIGSEKELKEVIRALESGSIPAVKAIANNLKKTLGSGSPYTTRPLDLASNTASFSMSSILELRTQN